MNDEEKKAIKHLNQIKHYGTIRSLKADKDIDIILNLIEKQQNEIQNLPTIDKEHQKLNGELREEIKRQGNTREIEEKYIEENFISKDKIREKIEEYKKPKNFKEVDEYGEIIEGEIIYKDIVEALQELLKEE